jgi:hypothetical protein
MEGGPAWPGVMIGADMCPSGRLHVPPTSPAAAGIIAGAGGGLHQAHLLVLPRMPKGSTHDPLCLSAPVRA